MISPRTQPILVLTGPTCVGKTSLSLLLAEALDAEIISADSRQIFQRLDIGTAKPSNAQRARVPHHFVDELGIGDSWSAGEFAHAAAQRIDDILGRERTPLVVGGSTLYIEALVHGLADVPKGDPEVRRKLNRQVVAEGGAAKLYRRLSEVDPAGAAQMDATKTQRIVRALEVYKTTGIPWSEFIDQSVESPFSFAVFVLHRPRKELYARINQRVDAMLESGLLDENRALFQSDIRLDKNPLRTIGYQEPAMYLKGEITYEDMVENLKTNSRRYAKRQLTWFRRHPEYRWLDLSVYDLLEDASHAILSQWSDLRKT
ncbi:MAG: tRNA (adenosine(37)-N6)-dimethylallyltransferase MiaA [Rubricoccaceae bacterium]|nr:tRNA (adenosine(37)-N6)-dimethylallyltransferase MiaA [Rubricoccaceae bacterium]